MYIDDIIMFAQYFDTHLQVILERITKAGLKLSPGKLFQKQVEFLGHIVSEDGIATAPSKTGTVEKWSSPKSVKELRSYLDLFLSQTFCERVY